VWGELSALNLCDQAKCSAGRRPATCRLADVAGRIVEQQSLLEPKPARPAR
jgi:hypothetical protein